MKGILSLYPEAQINILKGLGIYNPVLRPEGVITEKYQSMLKERERRFAKILEVLKAHEGEHRVGFIACKTGLSPRGAATYLRLLGERGDIQARLIPKKNGQDKHFVYSLSKKG